jgi:transposase
VEVQDESGRVLERERVGDDPAGLTRLHALIGRHLAEDDRPDRVRIGIETEHGPWVRALHAAGYVVFPVNPLQVARYRERHGVSGAKSDTADAHTLADLVRTDGHQLRSMADNSEQVAAIKVVARAHQSLIWERTRHTLRLRHALLAYFPAAVHAFADLDGADALQLLAMAPDPDSAAGLTVEQISGVLRAAGRRKVAARAAAIAQALATEQLRQPKPVTDAYAAMVRAEVAVLGVLHTQIAELQEQVSAHFGRHPDAEIYRSQPGLGEVLAARVLAEFGDDPDCYADSKARKNYAGTSPVTRQSGKRKTVNARHVYNARLIDALQRQAFAALRGSPGARGYSDQLRARKIGHEAALRQLANRLVGILHGCLKSGTPYCEAKAWPSHYQSAEAA